MAISNRLIPLHEIAALRSRPEGWRRHPEEVLLGCNDVNFELIRGSVNIAPVSCTQVKGQIEPTCFADPGAQEDPDGKIVSAAGIRPDNAG